MPKFHCLKSTFLLTALSIGMVGCFVTQSQAQTAYAPWQSKAKTTASVSPKASLPIQDEEADEHLTVTTAKPSALETMYTQRVVDDLTQFGYDLFSSSSTSTIDTNAPMGAVQDDFILGSGDEVQITFTGQRTDQDHYMVDPRGMLVIKDMPPIPVTGRTLSDLKESLNRHLSSMPNTQAYISLSKVRQIGVLVVGHVKHPGRKNLNVFHSVLDALNLSGGIKKDGSLRHIKLVRGGRSMHIDLYALLMHGAPHIDMQLRDGDRIIVPPIGPTVAISGAVKRSGIYEIKRTLRSVNAYSQNSSEKLSLNEMLDFAGGVLVPGQNRFLHMSLSTDGQEYVSEVGDPFTNQFNDGSILNVLKGSEKRKGTIELIGHTRTPGLYDLGRHKTLAGLLQNDQALGEDIYPLIAIIERQNNRQLTTDYISFPLRLVLKKDFDLSLQSGDVIRLLSNDDISFIFNAIDNDMLGIENMAQGSTPADDPEIKDPALISFLKERAVFLRGAVRKPGRYPVADGITLENLLAVAGGLTLEANMERIEITSKNFGTGHQTHGRSGTQRHVMNLKDIDAKDITVSPGDAVRVNQKFRKMDEKTVMIIGEVLHPGEYDLMPGDKVSDLIERAGGLSAQAYPPGAIFSRASERKSEEMRFRAAAHDMERRLAAAVERDKNPPNATQIEMVRTLADELSSIEAVGRITVETDPAILNVTPELDMLLEKGDRIYVPKRPLTVRVSGETLSPASLQFRESKDPLDYIHEAGGFTYHADKDRTFVLYPDGSAQPLQVNTWNHKPVFIPPGSTIVVPRDPKPFDFIESAKEIGQILSNLAVTSVFIDDIRD